MLLYLRGLYLTRKKMKMPCGETGKGPWGGPQPACGQPAGETVNPVWRPRRGDALLGPQRETRGTNPHRSQETLRDPQEPHPPPLPSQELLFFPSYFSGLVSKLPFRTKMVCEDALRYFQCQELGEEQGVLSF